MQFVRSVRPGNFAILLPPVPRSALRARDPRKLAEAIVAWPTVLSLTFGPEGEWVTVQTARPDEFYGALPDAALESGVSEMYSPDDDLESVFRYLVTR